MNRHCYGVVKHYPIKQPALGGVRPRRGGDWQSLTPAIKGVHTVDTPSGE